MRRAEAADTILSMIKGNRDVDCGQLSKRCDQKGDREVWVEPRDARRGQTFRIRVSLTYKANNNA